MKPKKPYSGKYPVLFYQLELDRFRIFYPNGHSSYSCWSGFLCYEDWHNHCCYGHESKSIDDLVKAANEYDMRCEVQLMEFIGEIK